MNKGEIIAKMESDLAAMQQMSAGDEIFDTGLVWGADARRRARMVRDAAACVADARTLSERVLRGITAGRDTILFCDDLDF